MFSSCPKELWVGIILFSLAIIKLIFNWNHLITMLVTLEFSILSIYLIMSMAIITLPNNSFYAIYFLTISICESVLGLTLLTSFSRKYSSEMTLMNTHSKW